MHFTLHDLGTRHCLNLKYWKWLNPRFLKSSVLCVCICARACVYLCDISPSRPVYNFTHQHESNLAAWAAIVIETSWDFRPSIPFTLSVPNNFLQKFNSALTASSSPWKPIFFCLLNFLDRILKVSLFQTTRNKKVICNMNKVGKLHISGGRRFLVCGAMWYWTCHLRVRLRDSCPQPGAGKLDSSMSLLDMSL